MAIISWEHIFEIFEVFEVCKVLLFEGTCNYRITGVEEVTSTGGIYALMSITTFELVG